MPKLGAWGEGKSFLFANTEKAKLKLNYDKLLQKFHLRQFALQKNSFYVLAELFVNAKNTFNANFAVSSSLWFVVLY